MVLACMTCMGIFGSGLPIGMIIVIQSLALILGTLAFPLTVSYAVAAIAATRTTFGPLTAAAPVRATAAAAAVFVSCFVRRNDHEGGFV